MDGGFFCKVGLYLAEMELLLLLLRCDVARRFAEIPYFEESMSMLLLLFIPVFFGYAIWRKLGSGYYVPYM